MVDAPVLAGSMPGAQRQWKQSKSGNGVAIDFGAAAIAANTLHLGNLSQVENMGRRSNEPDDEKATPRHMWRSGKRGGFVCNF